MTSLKFSNLSSDYLESLRTKTDPLADQVIAEIITSGEKSHVNELMMRLFQNDSFHQGLFDPLGENISSLLDRYARPTAGENSTGIGLSLVKTYVEKLNGKIRYEGKYGEGATFIVQLPVAS